MDAASMEIDMPSMPRSYQIEAFEMARRQNTIVFLETGSGKTLIAIMLLRNHAYLLRKPSPFIAVFLVPQVVLVTQQADALKTHTDLKVGMYWGDMGVDHWDAKTWVQEREKHEVLVMTPAILVNCLRHSFLKLKMIHTLIFDECHHARGKHPYACIMTEFYHQKLRCKSSHLPKIFGMTASIVKSKGSTSPSDYWKKISDLENLMNSKVYTCISESVLAEYIPFSNTKYKIYNEVDVSGVCEALKVNLKSLMVKHAQLIENLDVKDSTMASLNNKLVKTYDVFLFCVSELGVWLSLKAAEFFSCNRTDLFEWGRLDIYGGEIVKGFAKDTIQMLSTYVPSDWSFDDNLEAAVNAGFLTPKVLCLIQSLMEYRASKDLRCIIFVERVITAVVLPFILIEFFWKIMGWKVRHIAGNNTHVQSQSRKEQNQIVNEFRKGNVNIIVATSILEEGLDVQSCNLVIRFDPSNNVCSFIQSRGRARKQNSDFLLLLKSGDFHAFSLVERFLASGDIMREESLRHSAEPCAPLDSNLLDQERYCVESTGAIANLASSICLMYIYCSRLPSDGYFKPSPRFDIDKEKETCTLHLPKNCPIPTVKAQGSAKNLKQIVCLEACKQLHKIGALTDNLVPAVLEEMPATDHADVPYDDDKVRYFPPEFVNCRSDNSATYYCYLIGMEQKFKYDTAIQDIYLLVRNKLENDVAHLDFELEVSKGSVRIQLKYAGFTELETKHIILCMRFQRTVFGALLGHNINRLMEFDVKTDRVVDYYLLPCSQGANYAIDWPCIKSVPFPFENIGHFKKCRAPEGCAHYVRTKNGSVCRCVLPNSLVYTPHNGSVYCVYCFLQNLDANSILKLSNGELISYTKYFESRHGIELQSQHEPLLKARRVFQVQNHLQCHRKQNRKESAHTFVELPPEVCLVLISPISAGTLYSFSYMPTVMHRIESMLIAINLKRMHLDECNLNVDIPTSKVLEAITTKKCQEKFHLESLEVLGDSFLKYATSQHLFKTFQSHHEGILSIKREKLICNAALSWFGCSRKLSGFIRNEPFDPKSWVVPSTSYSLSEETISPTKKIYIQGRRAVKRKVVADVVEALIGAFLSSGGERAALSFMCWLGIEVEFSNAPYGRMLLACPEQLVNLRVLQSVLNYSFQDPSLLVEALTHGSYMLPEIPRCYQRLEFLGDALLDYLVTVHLYVRYPGISPGLLTDLRSASVNNECYALSAFKAGLQRHILYFSSDLQKHIETAVNGFQKLPLETTYGWEADTSFPKVLGDVIESLAGAIFVDSGYNKDVVFNSMRPLLEPMITPETVKKHPVRELHELCQTNHYRLKNPVVLWDRGLCSVSVEVEANGTTYSHTSAASDKETARKVASREVLNSFNDEKAPG